MAVSAMPRLLCTEAGAKLTAEISTQGCKEADLLAMQDHGPGKLMYVRLSTWQSTARHVFLKWANRPGFLGRPPSATRLLVASHVYYHE